MIFFLKILSRTENDLVKVTIGCGLHELHFPFLNADAIFTESQFYFLSVIKNYKTFVVLSEQEAFFYSCFFSFLIFLK